MSTDAPRPDPYESIDRAGESNAETDGSFFPSETEESPAPPPPPVECWRCGKSFPIDVAACPYCHAQNRHAPAPPPSMSRADEEFKRSPIAVVMWTYAIILLSSLIHGAVTYFTVEGKIEIGLGTAKTLVHQLIFFQGVQSLVIIGALVMCGRLPPRYRPTTGERITTWVLATPLLGLALGVNLAYHWAIREYTGMPIIKDELFGFEQLFALLAVSYCVQPAIIEELFMRYLFLGALNEYMGAHAAVWISAVAFGMLHLGAPLSIPYLIALGAVLGYLRVGSGGVMLPILFHFAHNAAVVAIEING